VPNCGCALRLHQVCQSGVTRGIWCDSACQRPGYVRIGAASARRCAAPPRWAKLQVTTAKRHESQSQLLNDPHPPVRPHGAALLSLAGVRINSSKEGVALVIKGPQMSFGPSPPMQGRRQVQRTAFGGFTWDVEGVNGLLVDDRFVATADRICTSVRSTAIRPRNARFRTGPSGSGRQKNPTQRFGVKFVNRAGWRATCPVSTRGMARSDR
jgi:hypothetical protein